MPLLYMLLQIVLSCAFEITECTFEGSVFGMLGFVSAKMRILVGLVITLLTFKLVNSVVELLAQ